MSKKLLLADDSITIQKVIQITFAHEDYELTITDNGDAALGKAREIMPDLIMSDIYMPGKNGYELTSAIKQDPALQHIPVLLLAGSFEPFDEDKARQCRADAWIEKPFESQSLIDKVAELLAASQVAARPTVPAMAPVAAVMPAPEPALAEKPAFAAAPATTRPAIDDDPFGDISFDDEVDTPVESPRSFAVEDDWHDLAIEPVSAPSFATADVAVNAVEEVFSADDFSFSEELPVEEVDSKDDFSFAEETLQEMPAAAVTEDFAFAPEVSVAKPAFDAFEAFDAGEDEIMPLGDDDILGAEDLEPIGGEQTLSPWSRDAMGEEDLFVEPLEEASSVEFAASASTAAQDLPAEAPVSDFVQAEEDPAYSASYQPDLPEPDVALVPEVQADTPMEDEVLLPAAAVRGAAEVESRAAAIGEDEIERIIESVVSRIVEKLAGAILEKVAWEVVPDLAEGLIREEIRKIKDDAA